MAEPIFLGEFEQVVLLAILRLEDEAYGVSIAEEIRLCTGRRASPGALYNTLDRLEEKGMVSSRVGEPTPQRRGRPKRFYTVTKSGIDAVARAQRGFQKLMKDITIPGVAHA
jgi:PadR family transcriptional regulator, regulatory protein PadR